MVEAREVLTALALALSMLGAAWIGLRQWLGVVILALLSFAWLTVDDRWEGRVLLHFGRSHGFVLVDLVGIIGGLLAVALAVRLAVHGRAR